MEPNYWNNLYWKKHLEENKGQELDFLSDLWVEKYFASIDLLPGGKVLDLGCGLGQYTKYFADKGFEVTSADISMEVLKKLKETILNIANKNVQDIKQLGKKGKKWIYENRQYSKLAKEYLNKINELGKDNA